MTVDLQSKVQHYTEGSQSQANATASVLQQRSTNLPKYILANYSFDNGVN